MFKAAARAYLVHVLRAEPHTETQVGQVITLTRGRGWEAEKEKPGHQEVQDLHSAADDLHSLPAKERGFIFTLGGKPVLSGKEKKHCFP